MSKAYLTISYPLQDILFVISNYKFKFMPLKYNCQQFFDNDKQMKKKISNTKLIKKWMKNQIFSPYKYSVKEILESALDPVINHSYHNKITKSKNCNYLSLQWIKYAKLTGFYKIIKRNYPIPFKYCKNGIYSKNKNYD